LSGCFNCASSLFDEKRFNFIPKLHQRLLRNHISGLMIMFKMLILMQLLVQ